jgi:hypothetical protein
MVVEDEHAIVGGQPQVAFNPRAQLQGRGEGDQAILWKAGAIVEAPVCEPLGPGIERVSP